MLLFAFLAGTTTHAANDTNNLQWITFPDARLHIFGLPWFKENSPDLYRLPKSAKAAVPPGVWSRAVAPDAGRICFSSDTKNLIVHVDSKQKRSGYFDAFVDGKLAGSAKPTADGTVALFHNLKGLHKDITIYLPHNSAVKVQSIGIDPGATVKPPRKSPKQPPFVVYGSSILQGTGAAHPSQTYPAVIARKLNLDFVNLGFGGAGKAEPAVVDLVNQIEACCYLFDLGKSYGDQGIEPFAKMLKTVRAAHPNTPIIVITPIYSTKETDPAYQTKSETLRTWMRDAANQMRDSGDKNIYVFEGLDLFSEKDKSLFHDPLHPNDQGCELMANRLLPAVRRAIQ